MFKRFVLAGMMVFGVFNSAVMAGEYSEARSVMVYKTDQYLSEYVTGKSISNIIELEIDPNGEAVFLDEIILRIGSHESFESVLAVAEKSDGIRMEDEHRTIAKTDISGEFVTLKNFNLGAFEETVRVEIALVSNKLSDELEVKVEVLDIKLTPQNDEVELAVKNMEESFTVSNDLVVDTGESIKVKAEIKNNSLKISSEESILLDKIFLRNMGGKIVHDAYLEINGEQNGEQYEIETSEIGVGSCELFGLNISGNIKIKLFDREGSQLDISKYFEDSDDLVIYSDIFSGHRVAVSLKI
ncbi:MAG: hypothetical protein COV02_00680 [Candidatus Terrybacteria bacterium CG10_big_fil_rev_8_21_14_0_10_41_10]|uniref:Adhesin domain-containing protein n=1 Tax=Candidatus Terrybacteria bacterium CG10_big_fil_rev_8_21_14_0_10_41_10 TaxID=1975026 RepID=A0A2M8LB43_9BACT|nr:MAG: hypothetical protein COV02_00680 [Candidatus Terrybacteria bacterium CG10_big_fil_rev_8_21_14_0_10_41_10]